MEMIALTSENRSILGPLEGLLAADNVEAYLVGGFVRDALLGRETKDIDLAVKADAHMLARKLAHALGASFVSLDTERDVARIVGAIDGDEFVIDVARLDGDAKSDMARRDFTINAMAVPLHKSSLTRSEILDHHGARKTYENAPSERSRRTFFAETPCV
jgi:poly(A) polymerase